VDDDGALTSPSRAGPSPAEGLWTVSARSPLRPQAGGVTSTGRRDQTDHHNESPDGTGSRAQRATGPDFSLGNTGPLGLSRAANPLSARDDFSSCQQFLPVVRGPKSLNTELTETLHALRVNAWEAQIGGLLSCILLFCNLSA